MTRRAAVSICHPKKAASSTASDGADGPSLETLPNAFVVNVTESLPMSRLPPVLTSPPDLVRQGSHPATSPLEYFGYVLWICGPLGVMLLAIAMSVGPDRIVSLPGFGPIPETCTLHSQLGIDCPGCGLTRGFIHLAHGRFWQAWSLNPVAPFMFAYVAWQIPLAVASLWASLVHGKVIESGTASQPSAVRMDGWFFSWAKYNQWLLIGLMVALLLRWVLRLVTGGLI